MNLTPEQEALVASLITKGAALRRFRLLDYYEPYLKQAEFHALGADHDERALIAGNQVGKTHCGGYEDAVHLCGEYPAWWAGKRFDHPVQMWVCGPNGEKVRDTTQAMLWGPWNKPDEFGTGFLPRDAIVGRPTLSRGVSGYYDTGIVKWKDKNGRLDDSALSTVTLKAYTEGRLAFASSTVDVIHGDEEDKGADFAGIYTEMRTRVQVKRGITYMTLTPLDGWTEFVTKMLREPAPNKAAVKMGLYDAVKGHDPARPHLGHYESKERVDEIIAGFPPHLRDAKAYGDPALGEGKIFLTDEKLYRVPRPDVIPPHWRKIWGLDFGGTGQGSHPFAAVLLAHDTDYDIMWLLHTLKLRGMTRLQHIPKMLEIAPQVPVAWPHDGNEMREGPAGTVKLAEQYKNPMPGMPGLLMLPTHSTWPEGGFSTAAAVDELDNRMQTGRFFACDDLHDFFDEARQYHRDKGLIVKLNDDILSAVYKGLMMKRYARAVLLGNQKVGKYSKRADEWWKPKHAVSDFDLWTGQEIPRDKS